MIGIGINGVFCFELFYFLLLVMETALNTAGGLLFKHQFALCN